MSKRKSETTAEYNARRRSDYNAARNYGLTASEARTTRGLSAPTFESRVVPESPFTIRGDALKNFKRWSSRKHHFPKKVLDWIHAKNVQYDKSENHHFGFRYFYHMYVDDFPEADARDAAEGVKT